MILGKYVYDEPLRGDEPNRIVYRPQAWYSVEGYLYELDPDEDVDCGCIKYSERALT